MKNDYILLLFCFVSLTLASQSKFELGIMNREQIDLLYKQDWFVPKYEKYAPKSKFTKSVESKLKQSKIEIFMGTWCHDTKTYLPRFLKLFDLLEIPEEHITIYNVDDNKKRPNKPIRKSKIKYLPTVIFYDGKREIGRIIEYPYETIVRDINKLFSS